MTAFHFIGIGGVGMSAIARLLLAEGHDVSGSDRADSPTLDELRAAGATVVCGHDGANVPPEAVVVRSTAIRPDNPEIMIAVERGQKIIHRAHALALAAAGKRILAVAGSHGKTTTSGMLAVLWEKIGREPSWIVGSSINGLGAGGHYATGSDVIVEADESDASFLLYEPADVIVTSVEADHLDFYGTYAKLFGAYEEFALSASGRLVACSDDEGSARLALYVWSEGEPVFTYGSAPADPRIPHFGLDGDRIFWDFTDLPSGVPLDSNGEPLPATGEETLTLSVPGAHNRLNATAAFAVALLNGVEVEHALTALTAFTGTGRRFELRGEAGGVRVVDDYAHHPSEIAATIRAAREALAQGWLGATPGHGRVLAIFQPHLFSRTRDFAGEFASALGEADDAVVTSIYPAREDPIPGVTAALITDANPKLELIEDPAEAIETLARRAQPGDILLVLGAGDITKVSPLALKVCG